MRRLCEAPPTLEGALAAIAGISEIWPRRPLRVGIGGEVPATRGFVLDAGCGGGVLAERIPGSPPLRIRRGPATRFVIVHDGKPPEEHAFVPEAEALRQSRTLTARAELARAQQELAGVDAALPALVRVRPRPWAFWLWPLRWLQRWRARPKLAVQQRVIAAVEAARRKVDELEAHDAERFGDIRADRARFFASIGGVRPGVTEIEIEVAWGPLPDGVELVELSGAARASADVDAVLMATRDGVLAPVNGGGSVRIGAPEQVLPALPTFLIHARALSLARRARDRLDAARVTLDEIIEHAEQGFAARLGKIEIRRVREPMELSTQQLEAVRPEMFEHVGTVMEHASIHLTAELAMLADAWTERIVNATTADRLRSAVTQIDAEWPAAAQRIASETRMLVTGGIGGSAHDLYAELTEPLRALGLTEPGKRPAPVIPPIAMLPSLSNPTAARWGGAGEWLVGWFRSLETRRAEIAAKARQRAEHVRDVARAELLDAEPRLHAALMDALAAEIDDAIKRQGEQLADEIALERAAIGRERAALSGLQRMRDEAFRDSREIADRIQRLELELPGTAAASAAARLSVGSMPRLPSAMS